MWRILTLTKMENEVSESNEQKTKCIETSSKYKWDLHVNSHSSNNQTMKTHYQTYCGVLTEVIKEAKHALQ